MTELDVAACAADQIDRHWAGQLRPRLAGLTDEEYFFDPTGGTAWTVHPRTQRRTPLQTGGGDLVLDFAHPEPVPAPFTTIAWRLAHVVVGVLAVRSHGHFAGPEASYQSWAYAGTAHEALARLDREFDRWTSGVHALSEADLALPCGPQEGPYADLPMLALVLHVNRELIHHGAEIALLRDLYVHTR
ncbi:serine/arginine repetitive matrix protein 1 [Kocuria rosea subsp. polaris]|uniref:Serine/arginine repetitive matrix protein 1 n=1 Tax=Kocuria rosea subsp. polaris TaxID=136273 RepID=A0A0W8I4L2_KOCRO|nr:DinB family protein [Kocuria polaris]KUG52920.1 serine/arginine repetitive matrix protein 1 [Kocuria polaris]